MRRRLARQQACYWQEDGPGDQATRQVSKVPVVPEGQEALVEEELRQVLLQATTLSCHPN